MLVIVSLLVNNKFQKITHGRTNEPAEELISRHTVDKKSQPGSTAVLFE